MRSRRPLRCKDSTDVKEGWSSECTPCKHTDAEHHKRHREIAELLHQLKELTTARSTETSKHAAFSAMTLASTPSPMSKKERKVARKAAKLAEMPKVVSTVAVNFVEQTLHPQDGARDEAEEERRLLEDPEIKLNLYFHKGTSNTRETRRRLIVEARDDKHEPTVEEAELDVLMEALDVGTSFTTTEEKRIVAAIRRAVRNDLIEVAREEESTMERKGGFWRWASTKAYKRLVQNGRIWGQKDDVMSAQLKRQDENAFPKRKDSAVGVQANEEEADPDMTTLGGDPDRQKEDAAVAGAENSTPNGRRHSRTGPTSLTVDVVKTPKAKNASGATDDWTEVGKSKLKPQKKVTGTVKLSLNNGMANFGRKAVEESMGRLSVWSLRHMESGGSE